MNTGNRTAKGSIAHRNRTFGFAVLAFATGWAVAAQAVVNPVAWYKLGEDDPGAAANLLGQSTTLDSSGNGLNLTRRDFSGASPTNRADVSLDSLHLGSTLSMQFIPSASPYQGSGYYTNLPVTTAVSNVVVEFWVKPLSISPLGYNFVINNGYTHGYSVYLNAATNWVVQINGVGNPITTRASLNQWQHIAMVLVADPVVGPSGYEDVQLYRNGILQGTSSGIYTLAPNTQFSIGMAGLGGTEYPFNGLIDQVRVSTFAPGQFNPLTDLLIPEPGPVAFLAIGGVFLGWPYRRRRAQ